MAESFGSMHPADHRAYPGCAGPNALAEEGISEHAERACADFEEGGATNHRGFTRLLARPSAESRRNVR
jgi:hypothetical protein